MRSLQNKIKKVSVILPNYNYAKYLKGRLKSILRQTYPIYELIILDDCSSDESIKIIEAEIIKIKHNFPDLKVNFIRNERNTGKAILQWTLGVKEATGDFIWIAEADDLSNSKFLETVMKKFDNPDVVMSYAESKLISGAGLMLAPNFRWSRDREKTGHFRKSYVRFGQDEIKEIMAIRCTIPNVSAVVFRKNAISLDLLKEASHFKQVGDWYLYAKILESGKIAYDKKALNYFRIHSGSVTRKTNSGQEHYNEVVKMHKWFEERYVLSDEIKVKMLSERRRIGARYGII